MTSGVYSIVDENGREYIGSSVHIEIRFKWHMATLRRGEHHHMQAAHDDGAKWSLVILEECSGDLKAAEQKWIDVRPSFYNHCRNARGGRIEQMTVKKQNKPQDVTVWCGDSVADWPSMAAFSRSISYEGVPLQKRRRNNGDDLPFVFSFNDVEYSVMAV